MLAPRGANSNQMIGGQLQCLFSLRRHSERNLLAKQATLVTRTCMHDEDITHAAGRNGDVFAVFIDQSWKQGTLSHAELSCEVLDCLRV